MRNAVIKFRASEALKAKIENVAMQRDTTVSALLRTATRYVADGRQADGAILADMAKIRQAANVILDQAQAGPSHDAVSSTRLMEAARAVHQIAARHLTFGSSDDH
jgi:hypothetical protein